MLLNSFSTLIMPMFVVLIIVLQTKHFFVFVCFVELDFNFDGAYVRFVLIIVLQTKHCFYNCVWNSFSTLIMPMFVSLLIIVLQTKHCFYNCACC